MDRGDKDKFCNQDKCDALGFIYVCGSEQFTKELLPLMIQGEEFEVLKLSFEKHPEIIKSIDPENSFWDEYYSEKSVFYSAPDQLKLKLTLLEKGFKPNYPMYKSVLEKSLNRNLSRDATLAAQFDSSNFKKELSQGEKDLVILDSIKKGSSSLNPITQVEFERMSETLVNSSKNSNDIINKRIEVVSLGKKLQKEIPCFSRNEINTVIDKKIKSEESDLFLREQINCQKISEKAEILSLMKQLQDQGMLSRPLFEQLFSKLSKTENFSEEEILVISKAVSLFDKESALRLSLLEFNSIEKFATDLNAEECPKDSRAHQVLLKLHEKIINDQSAEFLKLLADPNTNFTAIDEFLKNKEINFSYIPKSGSGFYSVLANKKENAFSVEEWGKLFLMGQKPTWQNAFDQIDGINDKNDKTPFGDVIRSQNVTLFKMFVEMKKKKSGYKFSEEKKAALEINRKSGSNETIKNILKDDPYFKD